jgi:hypothetical protein
MALDDLKLLPLFRGSAIVLGGDMAFTVAKRLRFYIGQLKPKLRVVIQTPQEPIDRRALNLIIPNFNDKINKWLERDAICGVLTAVDPNHLTYLCAITGGQTEIILPKIPTAVGELLQQLGY